MSFPARVKFWKGVMLQGLVLAARRYLHFDPVARVRIKPDRAGMAWLGSMDCGWAVPRDLPASGQVCYCFGAGEDITLDIALAQQRGCVVHTFDPTPRAVTHYESLPAGQRDAVQYHAVGLWTEDKFMEFIAPAESGHVSHSLVLPLSGRVGFKAECLSYASLRRRVGGAAPTLLKLDIEGAEMHVLDGLLRDDLPAVLLVEFDELECVTTMRNWQRVRGVIAAILFRGYSLTLVDRANYTFRRLTAAA